MTRAGDAFSDVLQDLRLTVATYGRCSLRRSWGITFPSHVDARFHFVVEGACWLRGTTFERVRLEAGDAVLLPRGAAHVLSDPARAKTKPLISYPLEAVGETTYRLSAGGEGAQTLLVCCTVGFGTPVIHPLLELMPPLLVVKRSAAKDPALPTLLDIMADEVAAPRMGTATVMARLADVVIARMLRTWVETRREDTTGWLAAVRDPQLLRALAAIHREPGRRWSIQALARVAGLSRTLLTERFATLVGVPPGQYLARSRMQLARVWLQRDRITLREAAYRLGYENDASFSRAFKRIVGVPARVVRRRDVS